MNIEQTLQLLTVAPSLSTPLKEIAEKVLKQERISVEEGVFLFEHGELSYLGVLANYLREKRHGDRTYFNRNFHIEPTNVCVYDCKFCSYSRLVKNRDQGWDMSIEEMMDQVRKYDGVPVTEVHITGGVVPKQDLAFYAEFLGNAKRTGPIYT